MAAPDIPALLGQALDRRSSDLHLTVGASPTIRVDGRLTSLEHPALDDAGLKTSMYSIMGVDRRGRFEREKELDFAYDLGTRARFRTNVFMQKGHLGAVFRAIPTEIPRFEDLGIPDAVRSFADMARGLVLVVGITGSGKSTTLASLLDIVNRTRTDHIVTVEDPIEFVHTHKSCLVNQREVGDDTHSFSEALRHVLRQDPDVILVGEMRDLETMSTAITAAETGHLVFATLHTQDAAQTVDRIIDAFPGDQQGQIRAQLSTTLRGVMAQQLLPHASGTGRVAACEVLVVTPAVRNLIREGKTFQIPSAIQAGGRMGMQTMDQSLANLVQSGAVNQDVAFDRCHSKEDLAQLLGIRAPVAVEVNA